MENVLYEDSQRKTTKKFQDGINEPEAEEDTKEEF